MGQRFMYLAVFLLFCGSLPAVAGDPRPVSKIDLQPFGYKPSDKAAFNLTTVKWWRQYLIIDSTFKVCGKCRPDSTYTFSPGPRLVVDTKIGKPVWAESVADAVLESNPQDDIDLGQGRTCSRDPHVLSCWRGMALVRESEDKLLLQQAAGDKTLIFSGQHYESATFLAPDRILIIGQILDNPHCTFCSSHQWAVDKSGELKYKLSSLNPTLDYYALNRAGTRFAVRDAIESKGEILLSLLALGTGAYNAFNTGRVRVFASKDGKKLFEYKWSVGKYGHDNFGGIALSEDGSLLALIDGSKLLIFQLPP